MLPYEEIAVMDRNSEFRGVPPEELMENAGKGLAEEIIDNYSERNVLFICGTGNNGGDAYVAARYISERWGKENVKVFLIKGKDSVRSDISRENLEKVDCELVEKMDWESLDEDTILVDALLGTGIKGDIREPYRGVIEKINGSDNPIVSVDVPSGLGADISVRPNLTVTFHDLKEGMSEKNSGEILIKDIGIPEKAITHTGPGEMILYPRPSKDSHKGENGRLLIVGGGPYTGAPVLAGKAAYRSGVDLVHLAVPGSVSDIISGYSANFIVHELEGERVDKNNVDKILKLSEESDAVIIGPGLGRNDNTFEAVKNLLERLDKPALVDADGLKAVSEKKIDIGPDTVLTPHKKEFEMLTDGKEDDKKLEERADSFAKENGAVLVVKGVEDYVTDGKQHRWNDFGNEGMTVGGTGDTLSGVIGALMAKGLEPFNSARLGAYMTCRAGDEAFDDLKWGLTPEDIIERLPETMKK